MFWQFVRESVSGGLKEADVIMLMLNTLSKSGRRSSLTSRKAQSRRLHCLKEVCVEKKRWSSSKAQPQSLWLSDWNRSDRKVSQPDQDESGNVFYRLKGKQWWLALNIAESHPWIATPEVCDWEDEWNFLRYDTTGIMVRRTVVTMVIVSVENLAVKEICHLTVHERNKLDEFSERLLLNPVQGQVRSHSWSRACWLSPLLNTGLLPSNQTLDVIAEIAKIFHFLSKIGRVTYNKITICKRCNNY